VPKRCVSLSRSNEWSGRESFGGRSLHALSPRELNPYERALAVIARTLAPFDDDGLIPGFGFGDASTTDAAVFTFMPGGEPARGCDALLRRYRHLAATVELAGPTSFAPVIHAAALETQRAGNAFSVLLLLADGQVTRASDTPDGKLSPQEAATAQALVEASHTAALAVVMVGLGDGPWAQMREFDDSLPARAWDNFQFVELNQLSRLPYGPAWDAAFALAALQEIPEAYTATQTLGLLHQRGGRAPRVTVLPPPLPSSRSADHPSPPRPPQPMPPRPATAPHLRAAAPRAAPARVSDPAAGFRAGEASARGEVPDADLCCVCLAARRDCALVPCGHVVLCFACGAHLMAQPRARCPVCRDPAQAHVKLFL